MLMDSLAVEHGVVLHREGALGHLRLQRPARRNALTMPMFRALAEALSLADGDESIQALLLSGEGSDFCAGHDLQAFDAWPQLPQDPVPQFLHALASFGKPLVMAVQGNAVGIGMTMLLHADWVVCAEDARLRVPFADLDIGPEAASSWLLAQAMGSVRARRLLLGGERLSGAQALDWGLISELAPVEHLQDSARKAAMRLGDRSRLVRQLRQWQNGEASIHARIDEEIQFINVRILAKRQQTTEEVSRT